MTDTSRNFWFVRVLPYGLLALLLGGIDVLSALSISIGCLAFHLLVTKWIKPAIGRLSLAIWLIVTSLVDFCLISLGLALSFELHNWKIRGNSGAVVDILQISGGMAVVLLAFRLLISLWLKTALCGIWMRKHQVKDREAETDFGRRYGWILLCEGRPVAELDYLRWDEASQFWHSYTVRWLESGDFSSIPFENWQESGFVLRSKKYHQVECRDYLATTAKDGTVLLRGAHVPSEVLVIDSPPAS